MTVGKKKSKSLVAKMVSWPWHYWLGGGWWRKVWLSLMVVVIFCFGGMYGIARWYIAKHAKEPFAMGVTFVPDYTKALGLDPKQTMQAMIDDLHVKRFRLVSYWNDIESKEGHYDFSQLDWQFAMANKGHAKVSLTLGLRQPRWPECHEPSWAENTPKSVWESKLNDFIAAVVGRYKDNPALDSYQLENEYFLTVFGKCTNFDRDRLVSEYNLVKSLDPDHTLVVTMSNNAIGTPIGAPTPDKFAISVYKRVWDKTLTHRYFEYPIPAWYYAFRAGWVQLTRHRDSFIHELQAEAWTPNDLFITDASLAEQNKSLDAARLKDRFEYGRATGMRTMDLWGAEYWYWRMVKAHDPSLWNVAKQEFNRY